VVTRIKAPLPENARVAGRNKGRSKERHRNNYAIAGQQHGSGVESRRAGTAEENAALLLFRLLRPNHSEFKTKTILIYIIAIIRVNAIRKCFENYTLCFRSG